MVAQKLTRIVGSRLEVGRSYLLLSGSGPTFVKAEVIVTGYLQGSDICEVEVVDAMKLGDNVDLLTHSAGNSLNANIYSDKFFLNYQ